ncbi:hypothetical protein MESS2_650183 [Mesorhizobium metallidurans STM 2683]|uniref:Uncharacterized protein n=1 Tax=Mesorhizobium metallidurans STM 2683 TaxID=1297569 RepID=M5EVK2_9HYPH|nr:hypothetical protein MESS2_650183 [Mesorhizobium metallidurans STM 2683]
MWRGFISSSFLRELLAKANGRRLVPACGNPPQAGALMRSVAPVRPTRWFPATMRDDMGLKRLPLIAAILCAHDANAKPACERGSPDILEMLEWTTTRSDIALKVFNPNDREINKIDASSETLRVRSSAGSRSIRTCIWRQASSSTT